MPSYAESVPTKLVPLSRVRAATQAVYGEACGGEVDAQARLGARVPSREERVGEGKEAELRHDRVARTPAERAPLREEEAREDRSQQPPPTQGTPGHAPSTRDGPRPPHCGNRKGGASTRPRPQASGLRFHVSSRLHNGSRITRTRKREFQENAMHTKQFLECRG